jgi:nicotinamidase-related amidase
MRGWRLFLFIGVMVLGGCGGDIVFETRSSTEGKIVENELKVSAEHCAVLVIDMWDKHWCRTLMSRTGEMVGHMNMTLDAARSAGMQVIFAPSGVLDFYAGHPARKAVLAISDVPMDKLKEMDWPAVPFYGIGCCECGADRPCKAGKPWTRQHAGLVIKDGDLLIDCNCKQELSNVCAARGITHLVYMGVHTNYCVLHRECGIKMALRMGFAPLLVRDLTDSQTGNGYDARTQKYDASLTPRRGNEIVLDYVERYICPTIQSSDLTGKSAFEFKGD